MIERYWREEQMAETDAVTLSGQAGRIAGGVAGFCSGARVGTAVIPVPVLGAAVGGVVGAVVGGEFGSWLGRTASAATTRVLHVVRLATPA